MRCGRRRGVSATRLLYPTGAARASRAGAFFEPCTGGSTNPLPLRAARPAGRAAVCPRACPVSGSCSAHPPRARWPPVGLFDDDALRAGRRGHRLRLLATFAEGSVCASMRRAWALIQEAGRVRGSREDPLHAHERTPADGPEQEGPSPARGAVRPRRGDAVKRISRHGSSSARRQGCACGWGPLSRCGIYPRPRNGSRVRRRPRLPAPGDGPARPQRVDGARWADYEVM
jgi:hypothetical protein